MSLIKPLASTDRSPVISTLEDILRDSMNTFAQATLKHEWYGKEADWVSRYVFSYLVPMVRPGTELFDTGQLGIEVGVAQPPGYSRIATRRDVVIWAEPRSSCWGTDGMPTNHPAAIMEWKVHRPRYPNRQVRREREWLRAYGVWQPHVLLLGVSIDLRKNDPRVVVARFKGSEEQPAWLEV